MPHPRLLVTTLHSDLSEAALVLLDLHDDTYRIVRSGYGPIHATSDAFWIVHSHQHRAVLEKYDRHGLAWARRLTDCLDVHGMAEVGDRLAVCSTGTNEVIWLDADGIERGRWSPQPAHEPDSWHINSLVAHGGRLYASCFGRFSTFRGWSGKVAGMGLLLDAADGRAMLEGLSAPHDPRRIDGAWIVNDSATARTLLVPDGGTPQTIATGPGFPRGLAVLDDVYAIGFSSPRSSSGGQGTAAVLVVDRGSHRVLKTINLPWPEIGHIYPAPDARVLDAIRRPTHRSMPASPCAEIVDDTNRAGALAVIGLPRLVEGSIYEVTVRLTNRGRLPWISATETPIQLSYQLLDLRGDVVFPEGARIPLPLPLLPGRSLTFNIPIDLGICRHLPMAASLRLTLVQETIAWWLPTERWKPAVVPLPMACRNARRGAGATALAG